MKNFFKYTGLFFLILGVGMTACSGGDASGMTDSEKIAADAAALDTGDITFASGDSASSVTNNFTLITAGDNGSTITWAEKIDSKNNVTLSGTGNSSAAVTWPEASGFGPNTVTLTATITSGSESTTKDISVTVIPPSTTKVDASGNISIVFKMVRVPGGLTFPVGVDDNGDIVGNTQTISSTASVTNSFWIAETEVTYELWHTVYTWATSGTGGATGEGQYTFANAGREGNDGTIAAASTNQEPVSYINWRDAIVWTNALTEYYNAQNGTSYTCAYYSDADYTTPIRGAGDGAYGSSVNTTAGGLDKPYIKAAANSNTDMANCTATGFRLPTASEWGLAARYINDNNKDGDIQDAGEYYPGGYASGATADYNDAGATAGVAWYKNTASTQEIKGKTANALGIYDMSGNVREWCFDWFPSITDERVIRGGAWDDYAHVLRVGRWIEGGNPYFESPSSGLRIVRTY